MAPTPARPSFRQLAREAHPAVVDGDDPAVAIQHGDIAADRGEDGRLHQLAPAYGVLCLLLRERVGKNLPDETQALHQLVRPGSPRR
jgi:hypothetical protein